MTNQNLTENQEAVKTAEIKGNKRPRKLTKKEREEKKKKEEFFERVEACKKRLLANRVRTLSRSTFNDRQLQEIRKRLETERYLLSGEKKHLSSEFRSELCFELEPHRSGNHHADINVEESIITQSFVNNRQKRLGKIDEAIERLDDGTYGICSECFEPIAFKRLLKTPIADCCSEECKREKERKEKHRPNGVNYRHQRADQLNYVSA